VAATATGGGEAGGDWRWWRRLRLRRRVVVVTAVTLIGVGAVVAVTIGLSSGGQSGGTLDNGAATSLATVVRRSLSSQTQSDATLGYAGSYNVVNQARGTVTALPSAGRVIRQGQSLYEVDGRPIILLYGSTPAYRSLSEGMSGQDARQLNADLVALGYATSADLDPTSDEFSSSTRRALKRLQADLSVAETGTLTLGQAVFLPGPV